MTQRWPIFVSLPVGLGEGDVAGIHPVKVRVADVKVDTCKGREADVIINASGDENLSVE